MNANEVSRGKALLLLALPSILLIIVIIISAEVWLRYHYRNISAITGLNEWKEGSGNNLTYYWDLYHPVYGWTNLPGYRSDARVPFRVTINNQGLRGEYDYSQKPSAGVKRIAVVGDSGAFGEDVDDDQTLPYYLEWFLEGSEVLNFGVHGHGLGEIVLRMEREVFAYNPQQIFIVLTIPPDFERTVLMNYDHPKPAFFLKDGRLEMKNVPVPIALHQRFVMRHSYVAAWLFGRPRQKYKDDSMILPVSRALMEKAIHICAERGIPLTVVLIAGPTWTKLIEKDAEVTAWLNEARQMVHDIGVEVSDQIYFLRDIQQREQYAAAKEEIHWGGQGNCMLARNLAQELAKKEPSWRFLQNAVMCDPVFPIGRQPGKPD